MNKLNLDWLTVVVKGGANRHRLRIMLSLIENPDQSVTDLADELKINFRTASEHTRKLSQAGLISKKYQSSFMTHHITPLGRKFIKTLSDL